MTARRHLASEIALLSAAGAGALAYTLASGTVADEMWILADAKRMTAGAVLYRDFWAYLTPLSYWLAAATFAIGGPTLIAARVVAGVVLLASARLLYRATREVGAGPWTATLPGLALVWALYRIWPAYSYHWLVLPGVAIALIAAGQGLVTRSPRAWALAGLAAAGAFLMIQSDGAIVAIALACTLAFAAACDPTESRAWRQAAGAAAAGLVLPLALAAGALAAQGALGEALQQCFGFTLGSYKSAGGVNDIAYATDLPALLLPVTQLPFWYGRVYHFVCLLAMLPAAALGACAWGLGLLARRLRGGAGWSDAEARTVPWAFAAVGFCVLATRGRADFIHAAFYAVPALVLAAGCASWLAARLAASSSAGWLRWAPQVALAAFVGTGALMQVSAMRKNPVGWLRLEAPDARVMRSEVVAWLRARVRPGDRVAAMPMGGLAYFYVAPPATRFTILIPPEGRYLSEVEFARAWTEIATNRPRFLVIVPYMAGRHDLDAFLRPPIADYRLAVTLPSSEFAGFPTHIYERRAGD